MLNVLTGKVNPSGKLAETYPYGYPDVPSADHFGKRDPQVQYRESLFIGYRYFETVGMMSAPRLVSVLPLHQFCLLRSPSR